MAIWEMGADAAGLGKDDPDFLGPVGKVELNFQIQLRGGVRFGGNFDCQRGRTFKITIRIRARNLGFPNEAGVGF